MSLYWGIKEQGWGRLWERVTGGTWRLRSQASILERGCAERETRSDASPFSPNSCQTRLTNGSLSPPLPHRDKPWHRSHIRSTRELHAAHKSQVGCSWLKRPEHNLMLLLNLSAQQNPSHSGPPFCIQSKEALNSSLLQVGSLNSNYSRWRFWLWRCLLWLPRGYTTQPRPPILLWIFSWVVLQRWSQPSSEEQLNWLYSVGISSWSMPFSSWCWPCCHKFINKHMLRQKVVDIHIFLKWFKSPAAYENEKCPRMGAIDLKRQWIVLRVGSKGSTKQRRATFSSTRRWFSRCLLWEIMALRALLTKSSQITGKGVLTLLSH